MIYKKIGIIFMCCLLVFTLTIQSPKRADAWVFALPAAGTAATGGYAAATMAAAGIAAGATAVMSGDELQDAVTKARKAALVSWNAAEPHVKESWDNAVATAAAAGESVVNLPGAFVDWYQNVMSKDVQKSMTSETVAGKTISVTEDRGVFWLPSPITFSNGGGSYFGGTAAYFGQDSYGLTFRSEGGSRVGAVSYDFVFPGYSNPWNDILWDRSGLKITFPSDFSKSAAVEVPNPPVDKWAEQVGNNVERVFEKSKQQGVKVPPVIVGATAAGAGALYIPELDQWRGIEDGVIVPPGELSSNPADYTVPDLVVERGANGEVVTGADGLPVVRTPAVSIPNVGVVPGVNVLNPSLETDVPIEGEVPGEVVPPVEGEVPPPKPGEINWKRLLTAAGQFTMVFPFSIPWDIGRAIDAVFGGLAESNSPPTFDWEIEAVGKKHEFTITLPGFIHEYMPFVRSVMVISFDLAIIYAVRKWFGGAT